MGSTQVIRENIDNGIYGEVSRETRGSTRVAKKTIDLDQYFQRIGKQNEEKDQYYTKIMDRISKIKELEGNYYENKYFNKYNPQESEIVDDKLHLSMELCNCNLSDFLKDKKEEGFLYIGEIYDTLTQLNKTFQIMSGRNIVSGNIKLENILVSNEGNQIIFKLTGFEIIPELLELTKKYLPEKISKYLPPELLENNSRFKIDQKTDLWSLGVIIYYLFFREFPFKGQTCQEVLSSIKKNDKKKTNFRELDDLIDGLLTFEKEGRLTWDKYLSHPFFKNNGYWVEYKKMQKIGEGQFSSVYKGINKDNGEHVAIKVIDYGKIEQYEKNQNNIKDIIKEIKTNIELMERLNNDYPANFIKIYKKFELENGYAYSMELCECDLKKKINNKIEEVKASDIYMFLIKFNKTLTILLNNNHNILNLKLENVLLKHKENSSSEYNYKLSSIGSCPKKIQFAIKHSKTLENLVYLSPEVFHIDKYDNINDLWSLGIIIHYFRFKSYPYKGKSFSENVNMIKSGEVKIKNCQNTKLNLLIKELLEKNVKKRLIWNDYFNHPFFNDRQYTDYYELIGENLAEGEYYELYKAKERKTQLIKMIKIINKEKIRKEYKKINLKPIDEKKMKKYQELLIKKIKIMKMLEEDKNGYNENTVHFYEFFNTQKEVAIVNELCDSALSQYLIETSKRFNLDEISDLLNQLNNTFKIMANYKIIHGNLNLTNILVKKDNNRNIYKLHGYGVNQEYLNILESFFSYQGRTLYSAPEVLEGGNLDIKSDLWSLGVVIYTLLFGKEPYLGNDNADVLKNIKENGHNNLQSSKNSQLDNLIRQLLTVNLRDRLSWEHYFDHPFLVGGTCWRYYTDKQFLGDEPYFSVYEVKEKDTNEKRVIKAINLSTIKRAIEADKHSRCTQEDLSVYINDFIEETKYMQMLQGENKNNINTPIFYSYFQTDNEFCIVREYCEINLRDYLEEKEKLNVKEIKEILVQLNNTFKIIHKNKLSHKNIILDNILIKKDKKNKNIYKLISLEFNKKVYDLLGRVGISTNLKYKAPEILNGEDSNKQLSEEDLNVLYQKADIWSLGIIIFILFFGEFPYEGRKPREILSNIIKYENARLNDIPDFDLRDLLKKMLTIDKEERIGWEEYFNHKLFSK